MSCTARIDGTPLAGTFAATRLTGDSPDAYNDVPRPTRVTPTLSNLKFTKGTVSVPPHSVPLCQLDLPRQNCFQARVAGSTAGEIQPALAEVRISNVPA